MPSEVNIQVVAHWFWFRVQILALSVLLRVPGLRRLACRPYHVDMRTVLRAGKLHAWPVLRSGVAAPGHVTIDIRSDR